MTATAATATTTPRGVHRVRRWKRRPVSDLCRYIWRLTHIVALCRRQQRANARWVAYTTLANRRRGLHLAGNPLRSGLRVHMAVTRLCASCGKGVLPYERVEVGGALFCGWCAGLVEAPAFDAAAGGSGDAGAATGEVG